MARFLALDWDSGQLIVLAADVGKSGVMLERVLAWPEAQPPGPTNAETIGQRLKDQLAEAKIAAAPLLVAVGRDRLVLKEIRFPAVPLARRAGHRPLSGGQGVLGQRRCGYRLSGFGRGTRRTQSSRRRSQEIAIGGVSRAGQSRWAQTGGVAPRAFGARRACNG